MRYARGCWGRCLGRLCEIVVRPGVASQRWRCLMRSVNVCGATLTCLSRCASVRMSVCVCVSACAWVCSLNCLFCIILGRRQQICAKFYTLMINMQLQVSSVLPTHPRPHTIECIHVCIYLFLFFVSFELSCRRAGALIAYPKRVTTRTTTTTTTPQKMACMITSVPVIVVFFIYIGVFMGKKS